MSQSDRITRLESDFENCRRNGGEHIVEMRKDVKEIKVQLTDLATNHIVFKTKVMVGWGFALTIISVLVNKLVDKLI